MRLVFFGTPDFAAHVLRHLLQANHQVVAVVTAPDKPSGRGLQVLPSPVKDLALNSGITVLQPENLKDPEFIHKLKSFAAEVYLVVAFRKLPEEVWKIPPRGTINLHASLLPSYRGAAPIQHAVIQGEKTTGLTTFFINENIDAGQIILQNTIEIDEEDTAGDVYEKMKTLAPAIVEETLAWLTNHDIRDALPQSQLGKMPTPAPKLTTENTQIDWTLSCLYIRNFIRGLAPYPGAWCRMTKKTGAQEIWKIYKARAESDSVGFSTWKPGTLVRQGTTLKIRCRDGWIVPESIQRADRKIQDNVGFLNGLENSGFHLEHLEPSSAD